MKNITKILMVSVAALAIVSGGYTSTNIEVDTGATANITSSLSTLLSPFTIGSAAESGCGGFTGDQTTYNGAGTVNLNSGYINLNTGAVDSFWGNGGTAASPTTVGGTLNMNGANVVFNGTAGNDNLNLIGTSGTSTVFANVTAPSAGSFAIGNGHTFNMGTALQPSLTVNGAVSGITSTGASPTTTYGTISADLSNLLPTGITLTDGNLLGTATTQTISVPGSINYNSCTFTGTLGGSLNTNLLNFMQNNTEQDDVTLYFKMLSLKAGGTAATSTNLIPATGTALSIGLNMTNQINSLNSDDDPDDSTQNTDFTIAPYVGSGTLSGTTAGDVGVSVYFNAPDLYLIGTGANLGTAGRSVANIQTNLNGTDAPDGSSNDYLTQTANMNLTAVPYSVSTTNNGATWDMYGKNLSTANISSSATITGGIFNVPSGTTFTLTNSLSSTASTFTGGSTESPDINVAGTLNMSNLTVSDETNVEVDTDGQLSLTSVNFLGTSTPAVDVSSGATVTIASCTGLNAEYNISAEAGATTVFNVGTYNYGGTGNAPFSNINSSNIKVQAGTLNLNF